MDLAAQDWLCLGGMKRAKDGFCKFVGSTVCKYTYVARKVWVHMQ